MVKIPINKDHYYKLVMTPSKLPAVSTISKDFTLEGAAVLGCGAQGTVKKIYSKLDKA